MVLALSCLLITWNRSSSGGVVNDLQLLISEGKRTATRGTAQGSKHVTSTCIVSSLVCNSYYEGVYVDLYVNVDWARQ